MVVQFEPGPMAVPASRKVATITSTQFLAASPETVLGALKTKYGSPLHVRSGGSNLDWIGRDRTKPDNAPVEIIANLGASPKPGKPGMLLTVTEHAYKDARPKPIAGEATASAPKL